MMPPIAANTIGTEKESGKRIAAFPALLQSM
jgi:hypothetical protein